MAVHSGQVDAVSVALGTQSFQGHGAALDGPLTVLLEQERAAKTDAAASPPDPLRGREQPGRLVSPAEETQIFPWVDHNPIMTPRAPSSCMPEASALQRADGPKDTVPAPWR